MPCRSRGASRIAQKALEPQCLWITDDVLAAAFHQFARPSLSHQHHARHNSKISGISDAQRRRREGTVTNKPRLHAPPPDAVVHFGSEGLYRNALRTPDFRWESPGLAETEENVHDKVMSRDKESGWTRFLKAFKDTESTSNAVTSARALDRDYSELLAKAKINVDHGSSLKDCVVEVEAIQSILIWLQNSEQPEEYFRFAEFLAERRPTEHAVHAFLDLISEMAFKQPTPWIFMPAVMVRLLLAEGNEAIDTVMASFVDAMEQSDLPRDKIYLLLKRITSWTIRSSVVRDGGRMRLSNEALERWLQIMERSQGRTFAAGIVVQLLRCEEFQAIEKPLTAFVEKILQSEHPELRHFLRKIPKMVTRYSLAEGAEGCENVRKLPDAMRRWLHILKRLKSRKAVQATWMVGHEMAKHFPDSTLGLRHLSKSTQADLTQAILHSWGPRLIKEAHQPMDGAEESVPDIARTAALPQLEHALRVAISEAHTRGQDDSSPLFELLRVLQNHGLLYLPTTSKMFEILYSDCSLEPVRKLFKDVAEGPDMGGSLELAYWLIEALLRQETGHSLAFKILANIQTMPPSTWSTTILELARNGSVHPSKILHFVWLQVDRDHEENSTGRKPVPTPAQIDLVHELALVYANYTHWTARRAYRWTWACFQFLHSRGVKCDARMTKAVVMAGIKRPIKDQLSLSLKKVDRLLELVTEVDGPEVSRKLKEALLEYMKRNAKAQDVVTAETQQRLEQTASATGDRVVISASGKAELESLHFKRYRNVLQPNPQTGPPKREWWPAPDRKQADNNQIGIHDSLLFKPPSTETLPPSSPLKGKRADADPVGLHGSMLYKPRSTAPPLHRPSRAGKPINVEGLRAHENMPYKPCLAETALQSSPSGTQALKPPVVQEKAKTESIPGETHKQSMSLKKLRKRVWVANAIKSGALWRMRIRGLVWLRRSAPPSQLKRRASAERRDAVKKLRQLSTARDKIRHVRSSPSQRSIIDQLAAQALVDGNMLKWIQTLPEPDLKEVSGVKRLKQLYAAAFTRRDRPRELIRPVEHLVIRRMKGSPESDVPSADPYAIRRLPSEHRPENHVYSGLRNEFTEYMPLDLTVDYGTKSNLEFDFGPEDYVASEHRPIRRVPIKSRPPPSPVERPLFWFE